MQRYREAYYADQRMTMQPFYEKIFDVDFYVSGGEQSKGPYMQHVSDLSFTFIHWRMCEDLKSGMLTIDDVSVR